MSIPGGPISSSDPPPFLSSRSHFSIGGIIRSTSEQNTSIHASAEQESSDDKNVGNGPPRTVTPSVVVNVGTIVVVVAQLLLFTIQGNEEDDELLVSMPGAGRGVMSDSELLDDE